MTEIGQNTYSTNDNDLYKTTFDDSRMNTEKLSEATSPQSKEPAESGSSSSLSESDSFNASDELKEMNSADETPLLLAWNKDDKTATDGGYSNESANNDKVRNLLSSKDQNAAYKEWKNLPVRERKELYDSLNDKMKRALNDKTSNWVRKEAIDNLSGEKGGAFSTFGADLNLVPKIGFEENPEKKARLGAHEYGDLMNSAVGDYNGVRTFFTRMQHPLDASNNYETTINRGAGTCGEMSLSLVDTYNGLFGNTQYPANRNHKIDCCQILGSGPRGTNHASTDLSIDGKRFVSDPAWYAHKNGSFEGFGESEWVNKPEKDFINFWSNSKGWGHALNKFVMEDGTAKGNQIYP